MTNGKAITQQHDIYCRSELFFFIFFVLGVSHEGRFPTRVCFPTRVGEVSHEGSLSFFARRFAHGGDGGFHGGTHFRTFFSHGGDGGFHEVFHTFFFRTEGTEVFTE